MKLSTPGFHTTRRLIDAHSMRFKGRSTLGIELETERDAFGGVTDGSRNNGVVFKSAKVLVRGPIIGWCGINKCMRRGDPRPGKVADLEGELAFTKSLPSVRRGSADGVSLKIFPVKHGLRPGWKKRKKHRRSDDQNRSPLGIDHKD